MKAQLLNIDGKKIKEIELPKAFSEKIREDIVAKVLEARKTKQPYSPSPVAGKQHAAKGKVVHRRHVWRSGYGRGASRVPRKIFSRSGSQFNWTAAEIPFARGGMRAHPPKVLSMINTLKINKKEQKIAFASALSATADAKKVARKYSRINEIRNVPFVVEGKITSLKIKFLLESLKNILGKEVFEVAVKKKSVRAGIGKRRGRKYKNNAGMLFVVGDNEKLKTNGAFDVVHAKNLSVTDLANGGVGRLTVYTENAIKNLGERIK